MSEDIQKPVGSAGLHLSESIREVNLEVIHIEIISKTEKAELTKRGDKRETGERGPNIDTWKISGALYLGAITLRSLDRIQKKNQKTRPKKQHLPWKPGKEKDFPSNAAELNEVVD